MADVPGRLDQPFGETLTEVVCMAVLDHSKHEHFAQVIAKVVSLAKAYTSAGYSEKGATQSARRMLTNAHIYARRKELQAELSTGVIALEISDRNARAKALQDRWDLIRVNWPRPFRRLLAGAPIEPDPAD